MSKFNLIKTKNCKKKFKIAEKKIKIAEMIVQKSKPLQLLAETKLTLAEFKIIDVYLGRIDSHNPENRTVVFTKGEIERLLGVKRIRRDELKRRIDGIYQTVDIKDDDHPERINIISLFEQSIAEADADGQWIVKLKCTPAAMKYIFNIDRIGYVRYSLHAILNLTSRYSYFLFLYLESNKFRKTWEVDVTELKQIIGCTEKTYDKYYFFNQKILKKAQKELQEKVGIFFTYRGKKSGRSTKVIEFTLTKLPKELLNSDLNTKCVKNPTLCGENIEQKKGVFTSKKNITESIILQKSNVESQKIELENSEKNLKCEQNEVVSLAALKKQCETIMEEDPFFAEVKEQFEYNMLIEQNLDYISHINFVFQILYDTLKATSPSIRIKGVDQVALVVKSRLLKLKPEEILYVVQKYSELKDVKNPKAFMVTMLYGVVGMPVPKIEKKLKTSYDLDAWLKSNSVTPFNYSQNDDRK